MENVDPFLCTHIVYSYLKLERNQLTFSDFEFEPSPPDGLGNFAKFTNLKSINPSLKLYGAVGGENTTSQDFSDMVKSENARSLFIGSTIEFLYYKNLDGFMLDWGNCY